MNDALTPRDYAKLLHAHDPASADPQPEADFWRLSKKERRRDGSPVWLTPPIIRHTGVQLLAALFGVQMPEPPVWPEREPGKCAVTCEVRVTDYDPVSDAVLLALTGVEATLCKEWPVREWTMQIGEVNSANAGVTGKQYPQIFAFKRAYDRAVLDHLMIFGCYGDTEAPEFAQNADYEATQRKPAGPAPGSQVLVSGKEWAKQDQRIREMARALVKDYKVPREQVDQVYLDLAGETGPLADALGRWLERKEGALHQEASDLFGGQDDGGT